MQNYKNIIIPLVLTGTTVIIKKYSKNYLKRNSHISEKYPILKKKIFRNLKVKVAAITLIGLVIYSKKSNTITLFKIGKTTFNLRKPIKLFYNRIRAKKSITVLSSSTTNSDTKILKAKKIVRNTISAVVIVYVFSPQIIGFICGLYFDVQDPRWWQNIKSLRYWRRYILSRLVIVIENPDEPDD